MSLIYLHAAWMCYRSRKCSHPEGKAPHLSHLEPGRNGQEGWAELAEEATRVVSRAAQAVALHA